jgi:hypothetical protein
MAANLSGYFAAIYHVPAPPKLNPVRYTLFVSILYFSFKSL